MAGPVVRLLGALSLVAVLVACATVFRKPLPPICTAKSWPWDVPCRVYATLRR